VQQVWQANADLATYAFALNDASKLAYALRSFRGETLISLASWALVTGPPTSTQAANPARSISVFGIQNSAVSTGFGSCTGAFLENNLVSHIGHS